MNEKLFKRLNEEVELVSIKNSVVITESDEIKLIFNGCSFGSLFEMATKEEINEFWINQDIENVENSQEKYNREVERLEKDPKIIDLNSKFEAIKKSKKAAALKDEMEKICKAFKKRIKYLSEKLEELNNQKEFLHVKQKTKLSWFSKECKVF